MSYAQVLAKAQADTKLVKQALKPKPREVQQGALHQCDSVEEEESLPNQRFARWRVDEEELKAKEEERKAAKIKKAQRLEEDKRAAEQRKAKILSDYEATRITYEKAQETRRERDCKAANARNLESEAYRMYRQAKLAYENATGEMLICESCRARIYPTDMRAEMTVNREGKECQVTWCDYCFEARCGY